MKKDDALRQKLAQTFDDFELEPRSETWDNIRAAIQPKRKKRRFVLWFWLAMLSLPIGAGLLRLGGQSLEQSLAMNAGTQPELRGHALTLVARSQISALQSMRIKRRRLETTQSIAKTAEERTSNGPTMQQGMNAPIFNKNTRFAPVTTGIIKKSDAPAIISVHETLVKAIDPLELVVQELEKVPYANNAAFENPVSFLPVDSVQAIMLQPATNLPLPVPVVQRARKTHTFTVAFQVLSSYQNLEAQLHPQVAARNFRTVAALDPQLYSRWGELVFQSENPETQRILQWPICTSRCIFVPIRNDYLRWSIKNNGQLNFDSIKQTHMKKNIFLTALCCFYCLFAQAQKEGNVWHFGKGAAVDFNSGTAQVTTPSSMYTFEGSASIADANGQLLFYSNGGGRDLSSGQSAGFIWNRNHQVMYDMGFTEGGGFSAAQSAVIIPRPGVPNHYYLFTMEEIEFDIGGSVPSQPAGRGLSYFEIDMTLNGGLGGVINYTPTILVPSYEGLCAVRHSNGSDYWIIAHNNESGLAVFQVTIAGAVNALLYNTPNATGGVIKGSPDGKWLTCSAGNGDQVLYQFDSSNGTISQPYTLSAAVNSVEFSPNSKRLFYIAVDGSVRYVDLTSADINASIVLVEDLQAFGIINGQMQLAPDGKIYFVQNSFVIDSVFLSTIVCPNTTPFVELNKLAFSGNNGSGFFGLPNFDNAIFRRDVDPPLPLDLGTDKTLCNGQSTILDAGSINNATYAWSNGIPTQTLSVSQPGTYTVTVTAPGCGIGVDSIRIDEIQLNVNAGSDQSICAGTPVSLNGSGNGTLSWSPAGLVSNANIANPLFTGNQSVTLVLTATQSGCTATDAVQITVSALPTASILTNDTTIQSGVSVQLAGTGTSQPSWSPATGLSCTNCLDPIATPIETTTYTLTIFNADSCSATETVTITVTPPDCSLSLPNVFTPNGDTVNDDFKPIGASIASFELRVYNRWGVEVYKGNQAWNGKLDNQDAPSDVYAFRVRAQVCGAERAVSGGVSLVR